MASKGSEPSKKVSHPQKRKHSGPSSRSSTKEPPSGRAAKRTKLNDARDITSQPLSAGLAEGGELDLQAFLNAREFEINALEGSMRRVKDARASRAHQQVPRDMRRRTASHNVKRLPKRLRNRASKEQKDDNTPHVEARTRRPRSTKARIRAETAKKLELLAKRKRGRKLKNAEEKRAKDAADAEAGVTPMEVDKPAKDKVIVQTRPARPKILPNKFNEKHLASSKYKRRQKDVHWLPTHLWHAKRAKIEKMWDFKIPVTPTKKSYRATHRAIHEKGAVCWDTSYYGTIKAYGKDADLKRLINALPNRGIEALAGSRRTCMYSNAPGKGLHSYDAPLELIWQPLDETLDSPHDNRALFFRMHPLLFHRLWEYWQRTIRQLQLNITIEDLRWEVGSINVTGPAATEVLLGILRPYPAKSGEIPAHAKVLKTLGTSTAPSIVPGAAVLSFDIQDPRLQYPPRTYRDDEEDDAATGVNMARLQMLSDWPADEIPHVSALFDTEARFRASCLPSQKSINRRRGDGLPGTPIPVAAADPPIPIMLLADRGEINGSFQGTWTLLAPWKCILPLWHSLMHYPLASGGNPRFGCLEQAKQVKFEQGMPFFPRDFPGSEYGLHEELQDRLAAHMKVAKKAGSLGDEQPYSGLELGAGRKGEDCSSYSCDWELLFGWNVLRVLNYSVSKKDWVEGKPPADAVITKLEPAFYAEKGIIWPEWVKQHPLFSTLAMMTDNYTRAIIQHRSPETESLYENAIASVRITMIGRGVPTSQARIYRLPRKQTDKNPPKDAEVPSTNLATQPQQLGLPTDLREQWLALLPQSNRGKERQKQKGKGSIKQSKDSGKKSKPQQPRRMPPNASVEERKSLLAASVMSSNLPYPRPERDTSKDMDGHPLVPGKEDLMGFITTGGFNIALGKGMGIGHLKVRMIAEDAWSLRKGMKNSMEGKLCIVRNKGESVGWLARWDLVDSNFI